jgi:hypothetical protein
MSGMKTFSPLLARAAKLRGQVTPPDVNVEEARVFFASRAKKSPQLAIAKQRKD